jgi:hypothetical protein
MQDVHVKLKTPIAMASPGFNKKNLYTSKFDLNFGRIQWNAIIGA